jgi:hypothetical protein
MINLPRRCLVSRPVGRGRPEIFERCGSVLTDAGLRPGAANVAQMARRCQFWLEYRADIRFLSEYDHAFSPALWYNRAKVVPLASSLLKLQDPTDFINPAGTLGARKGLRYARADCHQGIGRL